MLAYTQISGTKVLACPSAQVLAYTQISGTKVLACSSAQVLAYTQISGTKVLEYIYVCCSRIAATPLWLPISKAN